MPYADKKKRKQEARADLVYFKGGKCEKCGYSAYIGALTFHHRDPLTKAFELSHNACSKPWGTLAKEANKCDLLCHNCHAEEHALLRAFTNGKRERAIQTSEESSQNAQWEELY